MLVRPPRAELRSPQHRAYPDVRPGRRAARSRRIPSGSSLIHGTVWTVLALAGAVALIGGLFAPPVESPAAASALANPTLLVKTPTVPEPPPGSGTGRRVIFDQSDQRVWLVAEDGSVERSYLVSGSKRDNVYPGTYSVRSRTRYARSYTGSGTFEYFVRFTQGKNAPIGFHTVTTNRRGQLVLAREDLGTPRSPGCVEQWADDAKALWDFAPNGTKVVVTA